METPEEQKNKKKPSSSINPFYFFEAGIEFAFLIGAPLGLFAFLQNKFNHGGKSKLFTIVGLLLALTISVAAVGKRIIDYKNKLK